MLCDPKNVLGRINKNLAYEVINSRDNPDREVHPRFQDEWLNFIFKFYFKLIFILATKGNLEQINPQWEKVINFNEKISYHEFLSHVKNRQVIIAVFQIPIWLSRLELVHYKENEHANYLFLKYNPIEKIGKRVTLSYHRNTTLDEVKDIELRYKQLLTKKSVYGVILGFVFLFFDYLDKLLEINLFADAVLVLAVLLILYDIYEMMKTISGHGMNDVILSFRKSMTGRLDSTHTLIELEHLLRLQKTSIALTTLHVLKTKKINVFDPSVLHLNLVKQYTNISKAYVTELIRELDEFGIIDVSQNGEVTVLIEDEMLENRKVLDERLYEQFDLDELTKNHIYETYEKFSFVLNMLLQYEGLERLNLQLC
ncbi:MAG: hypothetical protein INQ03_09845 [Candidatus Heimdallarchaeota archaeon]|nr:hypothetical protein [Candidatus Heimdallarchaeota archaeon]